MRQESRKISVRMEAELLEKVMIRSEKEGIEKSEYIRQAVREKVERDNSIIYIEALCRLSTMYNRIIEKYEVSEADKNEMKRELDVIWRK